MLLWQRYRVASLTDTASVRVSLRHTPHDDTVGVASKATDCPIIGRHWHRAPAHTSLTSSWRHQSACHTMALPPSKLLLQHGCVFGGVLLPTELYEQKTCSGIAVIGSFKKMFDASCTDTAVECMKMFDCCGVSDILIFDQMKLEFLHRYALSDHIVWCLACNENLVRNLSLSGMHVCGSLSGWLSALSCHLCLFAFFLYHSATI